MKHDPHSRGNQNPSTGYYKDYAIRFILRETTSYPLLIPSI